MCETNDINFNKMSSELKKYFPVEKIRWRIGKISKDKTKGLAFAYIDARDVMDRLDNAIGFGRWSCSYPVVNDKFKICRITINVDNKIFHVEDGAANTEYDADKGGLSDSFKRAAVKLGIGRYLYNIKSNYVKIDQYKNIIDPPIHLLPNYKKSQKTQTTISTHVNQATPPDIVPSSSSSKTREEKIDLIKKWIWELSGKKNKEEAESFLYMYTSFKTTDGKTIKGTRSFSALENPEKYPETRLNTVYGKIKKDWENFKNE